jgi:hypothetical protein
VSLDLRSFGIAVTFYALTAHAQAAAPVGEPPRVVDIEVDGSPAAVERLRATATEVLGRIGISARVHAEGPPLTPESPSLARAYVDLEILSSPRLVVVDSASQRELARRTLASSPSLETSIEAIVLVLYLVIEARLEQRAAVAGKEAEPSATATDATVAPSKAKAKAKAKVKAKVPPPTPAQESVPESAQERAGEDATRAPARTTSGLGFDAGPLVRVGTLDGDSALAGAGLALEARAERLTPRLGALFFVIAHLPTEVAFGDARTDIDLISARLLPTFGFDITHSLSSTFGIGGGIDWLRAAPQNDTSARGYAVSLADVTLGALAGVRWVVAHPLIATAAASFDIDWSPRTFSARRGDQRTTLLELDRFRPSLLFGLALSSGER